MIPHLPRALFNTAYLYLSEFRASLPPSMSQALPAPMEEVDGVSDFIQRISLKSKPLNARSFYLYLRFLNHTYFEQTIYCACSQWSGMGGCLEGLSPVEALKPYLAVEGVLRLAYPFVFKGAEIDHMVLIWVDLENRQIFYYDPQGLASDDPKRINASYIAKEFNLKESLEELSSVCRAAHPLQTEDEYDTLDFVVIENAVVTQSDLINCGTLVLYVLEQLYKGRSMKDAIERAQAVDISLFREEMIQNVEKTNTRHAFTDFPRFCSLVRQGSLAKRAAHEILVVAKDSEPCLDLRSLELKSLPPCLTELTDLVRLILKNNDLRTLPYKPSLFPKLKYLDLRENPLSYAAIDEIEQLKKTASELQILYTTTLPIDLGLPMMLGGSL